MNSLLFTSSVELAFSKRLPFAVAHVDDAFIAENDGADRRVVVPRCDQRKRPGGRGAWPCAVGLVGSVAEIAVGVRHAEVGVAGVVVVEVPCLSGVNGLW